MLLLLVVELVWAPPGAHVVAGAYTARVAGRPKRRAQLAAQAEAQLRREREREIAELTGPGFEGHAPPVAPDPNDLPELPDERVLNAALPPELRAAALHELWPKALQAVEDVLDDEDASPASKIQAARLVASMKEKQMAEEAASRPVRMIFETAAYSPDAA